MKGITGKQVIKLLNLITVASEVRYYTDLTKAFLTESTYDVNGKTIYDLLRDIIEIQRVIEGLKMLKRFAKTPGVVILDNDYTKSAYNLSFTASDSTAKTLSFVIKIGFIWQRAIEQDCFGRYDISQPNTNIDLVKVFGKQISVLSQFKIKAQRQLKELEEKKKHFLKTNEEILASAC